MEILAQAETVIVEKVLEGLAKRQPMTGIDSYVFTTITILLFVGSFLVLRYMLGHNKEIHQQAQEAIKDIARDYKETTETQTTTFRQEMEASRQHHERVTDKMRDMANAARDIAFTATSSKEAAEAFYKHREKS